MAATPVWLAPLEATLNRNIAGQARALQLLGRLEGKSLQLDIEGILRVRAQVQGGRLALLKGDDSATDALISGPVPALLMMMTGTANKATGDQTVQVRGDAEVAGQYRELLTLARPDFEEEAARLVGDVPARRLGNLARSAFGWLRRTGRSAGTNVAEYLQEESRDLVNRTELDEFLRGVDELRERADRFEARLRRLDQRLGGTR